MKVQEKKTFRGKHILKTFYVNELKGNKVLQVQHETKGFVPVNKITVCISPTYQTLDINANGTWLSYKQEFTEDGYMQSKSSIVDGYWIWTSLNEFAKFFEKNLNTFMQEA